MRRYKVVRRGFSILFVVMMTGLCFAAGDEPQEQKDDAAVQEQSQDQSSDQLQDDAAVQEHLEEELRELGKKYGYVAVGTTEFPEENDWAEILFPEEAERHSQGIVFSDIHDYDGDGASELLLLRRQNGYVNFERAEWNLQGLERSEYLFEMYEYHTYGEGHVALASRFVAGAVDRFNLFTSHKSLTVFRKDEDGRTDIFMETLMAGQDHPEDICLLRLRYENERFCDYSGIRYGALYFGEGNVRYMESKTVEALGVISYSGSAIEKLWEIKAAENEYNDTIRKALREGLAEFGLTLLTTRYDYLHEQDESRETDTQDETASEPSAMGKDAKSVKECSALDFYGTENGELTPLVFSYIHRTHGNEETGRDNLKLSCCVYTDDPEGVERECFDS